MNDGNFAVRCDATPNGHLQVATQALSIGVGQLIKRDDIKEMWQSVLVICEESEDGSLTTRIILCHPEWEHSLQIASIQSRPSKNSEPAPPLEIDLTSSRV